MKASLRAPIFRKDRASGLISVLLVGLLTFGNLAVLARQDPKPASAGVADDTVKISNDQLDALVAPIALYPDPLLSQVLVASTYPLEIVQLHQWLTTKGSVMDKKAASSAIQQMDLDESIQAMATMPDVLKRLADNIRWTTDLGNAFLAQQSDVMDALQRMRTKAKEKGTLKSNEQMTVETKQVEDKTVVVIEQSNPEVVYVPSYNPEVVWGVGFYAYPPMYYPPYGYYGAGVAIGFGVGIAVGVGWGWGCGWGSNDININRNNNFNRNTNINRGNLSGGNRPGNGGGKWQHNPQHRGGAPYSNKAVSNKYSGGARGDSVGNRQGAAGQNANRGAGGGRGAQAGGLDLSGLGGRGSQAGSLDRSSLGSRPSAGSMDRAAGSGLGGGAGSGSGFGGAGGDRIGSRDVSRGGGASGRGSWGGNSSFGGSSMGGSSVRSSSSRGSSSMSGSRGGMSGGGMRGGGGGMRGGGGRRR